MQAAADLEQEGISVEVIDLRTVRPLDYETILNSVKKTNRLVVLEEAWPFGSVASEITYMVQQKAFDYLDAPIKRITTPDAPAPYSAGIVCRVVPEIRKSKRRD
jgi:pyruvate dehydrogenase E1 component beta subunit